MNLHPPVSSSCDSQWVQMMIMGVEEIIGPQDAKQIMGIIDLDAEKESEELRTLPLIQDALEEFYGQRGGQGVSLRAGQVAFKRLLRQRGVQMGLFSPQFRLLPTQMRIRIGLETLAEQIGALWREKVTVSEEGRYWTWRTEQCPICVDQRNSSPVCYFTVGFLQEFLSWTANGKSYLVVEKECVAMGHPACLLLIDQVPVEG